MLHVHLSQVDALQQDEHVYMTRNGRISLAGVTTGNVERLAKVRVALRCARWACCECQAASAPPMLPATLLLLSALLLAPVLSLGPAAAAYETGCLVPYSLYSFFSVECLHPTHTPTAPRPSTA